VRRTGKLPEEEAAVLRLLERRLAKAKEPLADKLRASIRHLRSASKAKPRRIKNITKTRIRKRPSTASEAALQE
jgi:hypothetical protein